MTGTILFPATDSAHIEGMVKGPDRPGAPKVRDPAKHSKKDPAKPTRAKAARPDASLLDPALADLLNPAIGQGRAGVGSQTGIEQGTESSFPSPREAAGRVAHRGREAIAVRREGGTTGGGGDPTPPTPDPSPPFATRTEGGE